MKPYFLLGLAAAAVIGTLSVDAIPQDPAYHEFADTRSALGVPNFGDVLSNLPFLLVGLAGLLYTRDADRDGLLPSHIAAYRAVFTGIALTAIGSAWYHLAPDNSRLAWDRLPMTIAFMGLTAVVVGEQVSVVWGRRLLLPLLIVGAVSVFYWDFTEARGAGDLRAYALVIFLPALLIPAMLLLYRSPFDRIGFVWGVIGIYAIAKVFEHFDAAVFAATGFISGHALKHLVAALATAVYLYDIMTRRRI